MGDRANIVIQNGDEKVVLYTHWSGSEIEQIARAGMKRGRDDWSDISYLSRIVFCEMIKDEDKESTKGFGISSAIGDGEDNVLVIDISQQIVTHKGDSWTFSEFIA